MRHTPSYLLTVVYITCGGLRKSKVECTILLIFMLNPPYSGGPVLGNNLLLNKSLKDYKIIIF